MKSFVFPAFTAGILLVCGCNKGGPGQAGETSSTQRTGVVEVVPSIPKHLQFEGKDCTLTATPLANGNFAVFIEGDFGVTDQNSHDGVPATGPLTRP